MKTLYLFRHGDASNDADSDYSRELTVEGITQTKIIAEYLKTEGIVIDLILSSGAPRAMATAEEIAGSLSYPVNNIQTDDIIYDAKTGDELYPLIHKTPEHVLSLMIVGHNPVLSDLASSLVNHGRKIDMSKSSVVKIAIDSTPWKEVGNGRGAFLFYKKPVKGDIETVL